jgi:hypothetical protein
MLNLRPRLSKKLTSDDDSGDEKQTPVGKEKTHIGEILRTFDFESCDAWEAITHKFSTGIRHRELCSIALVIVRYFGVRKISRDARRSFPVLIKWFQDNWSEIEPLLSIMNLLDENEEVIDHDRELRESHRIDIHRGCWDGHD